MIAPNETPELGEAAQLVEHLRRHGVRIWYNRAAVLHDFLIWAPCGRPMLELARHQDSLKRLRDRIYLIVLAETSGRN